MQEINVFIGGGQIFVDPSPPRIHRGEPVVWRFHNSEPGVKWGQVEFPDPTAKLFKSRQDDPPARQRTRGTDVGSGQGIIMGTAPALKAPRGMSTPPPRAFKYTVRGLDKDGGTDKVERLDPQIIIEDP